MPTKMYRAILEDGTDEELLACLLAVCCKMPHADHAVVVVPPHRVRFIVGQKEGPPLVCEEVWH